MSYQSTNKLMMQRWIIAISFLLFFGCQSKVASAIRFRSTNTNFVYANHKHLRLEGRWILNHQENDNNNDKSVVASADWPCSSIHFRVKVHNNPLHTGLRLHWHGVRTRILIRIESNDVSVTSSDTILLGPAFEFPFAQPDIHTISFPSKGIFSVTIRKLNNAVPFGMGIANSIFQPSILHVYGFDKEGDISFVRPNYSPRRFLDLIGASDTAGYCVDGTPDMSVTYSELAGWEYDNCDAAYGGDLAKRFHAQVSFQASAGMGVTQNAAATQEWQLGPVPLPALINRTLMTNGAERWDYESEPFPNLILVSLGGNDFNHQGGHVPTDEDFSSAYRNLLLDLFLNKYTHKYRLGISNNHPMIVSVCGQGSPNEGNDQNRCRACPHIESAVQDFKDENPLGLGRFVDYIFVPCDGSVVTGVDDIGCNGHKNRLGQKRVADFLEPRLRKIMGWPEGLDEVIHTAVGIPVRVWYYVGISVFALLVLFVGIKLILRRRRNYTPIEDVADVPKDAADVSEDATDTQ